MQKIQPVILAGGTGSRLWPLSRELYPKQLLQLIDETSLLQTTVLRVSGLTEVLPPLLVVGEEHRFITRRQVDGLGFGDDCNILLEPIGRNTAPAVCAAVEYCATELPDDTILLVLPADHLILRKEAFQEVVAKAVQVAAAPAEVADPQEEALVVAL